MKVIVFPVILVAVILFFSCKQKSVSNFEEMARRNTHPESVIVKTVKAEKTIFYHELISNGKIASSEKAFVPFRVNGIIKELYIQNGQRVTKNQLLAVIEDFEYLTQLHRAQQNLQKAQINFRDDILTK